jgi:hypothetical protein
MRGARSLLLVGAVMMVGAACAKTDSTGSSFIASAPQTTAPSTTPTTLPGAIGVAITSPAPDAVIGGNVVTLSLTASGIQIVKADGDTSGKTGHFHVFVDRDAVPVGALVPKEAGIIHSAAPDVVIRGLSIGKHRFVVALGDGTHHRIDAPTAQITVTISGPSVSLSAPAIVQAGTPATLDAKVDGVTIVAADGDTSGKTGHLHYFVDREPTPPGQIIVKEAGIIHSVDTHISIPGLAPGSHTVIVELGDGTHKAFDPPVQAEATFIVQ